MGLNLNGISGHKDSVKFFDFVKDITEEEQAKATEEEQAKATEEEKDKSIFNDKYGNGETEEAEPITMDEIDKAIEDIDKDDKKTYTEKNNKKAKLENKKEKEKLEDTKKANTIEDKMQDSIKFDKDLQPGLEYKIKNIQNEQEQQRLLKELAILKLGARIGEDKDKTEQKINLVYEA